MTMAASKVATKCIESLGAALLGAAIVYLGACASVSYAPPAPAGSAQAGGALEEITVTGSRIDGGPRTAGTVTRRGCQSEREACSPQQRWRKQSPKAAHEIELKREPRICCERRINRPVRQRDRQLHRCPGDRGSQQQLTKSESQPRLCNVLGQECPEAAADSEPHQEHGQDDRERVNGSSQEERQKPRPNHLRPQGTQPRKTNRQIDGPLGAAKGLRRR